MHQHQWGIHLCISLVSGPRSRMGEMNPPHEDHMCSGLVVPSLPGLTPTHRDTMSRRGKEEKHRLASRGGILCWKSSRLFQEWISFDRLDPKPPPRGSENSLSGTSSVFRLRSYTIDGFKWILFPMYVFNVSWSQPWGLVSHHWDIPAAHMGTTPCYYGNSTRRGRILLSFTRLERLTPIGHGDVSLPVTPLEQEASPSEAEAVRRSPLCRNAGKRWFL